MILRPPVFVLLTIVFGVLSVSEAQTITPKHSRKFTRYDNCQFVPTTYVDGDSFKVRIREQEFVFRLYYVDCPEADDRFPDRNEEQAQYFGITTAESLAAGRAAKDFVGTVMAGKEFTVFTRWSSALGSSRLPRYYAIIEVDGRGLADLLVENGFARLHGTSVNHPNGTKADAYIATLATLEESAKAQKAGAWANSKPALQHPSVEEVKETWEVPRWLDRLIAAAMGAATVGTAWLVRTKTRRRAAA